jgi:alkylation response protein AidB-like acyl-CoA dehydrogenase
MTHGALRAAFLTPIAKAFGTDTQPKVASTGVQVHGGMGFAEETGAAHLLRDVRVTAISRRHQRHPSDGPAGRANRWT